MKDRRTKKRVKLKPGEVERKDGYYVYRWTASDGKRHGVVAKTLDELRLELGSWNHQIGRAHV